MVDFLGDFLRREIKQTRKLIRDLFMLVRQPSVHFLRDEIPFDTHLCVAKRLGFVTIQLQIVSIGKHKHPNQHHEDLPDRHPFCPYLGRHGLCTEPGPPG